MTEPQELPRPHTEIDPSLVSLADYERRAVNVLPEAVFAYIAGGSADEVTLNANAEQYARYAIIPRALEDVSAGSTRTQLLGQSLAHPILLAPVAYQRLAHPHGEIETALGAEALDTTMVLSTLSSVRLEDVAAATTASKWFQLYFQPQREKTLELLRRAEAAGYSAVVVTIDASIQAMQNRAERAGFRMPDGISPANLSPDASATITLAPDQSRVFQGVMQDAPTWNDLEWLRAQTELPLLIKGILHPDDAERAIALGANGLVVSNHGGRALDRAPATTSVLPSVRQRVDASIPVLLDGGIRRGGDVFTAVALGADAVLIGRPQMYALAVAGSLGVAHMLRIVRDELEVTMALAGCADINQITDESVTLVNTEGSTAL